MIHALPPFSRILLASALAFGPPAVPALAAAPHSADPPRICIPWSFCHPPLPGRLTVGGAGSAGQKDIQLLSWSWGAAAAAGRQSMRASSDPEEGGEVTSKVYSSDPQEGGEVASKVVRKPSKPVVSEMTVSKRTDVASPMLRSAPAGTAGPGTADVGDLQSATGPSEPSPSGTLTIVAARGSCASGKHIPEVKLSARGRTFTLHDVDVTACSDSGDNTDTCTLSYRSVAG